MGSISVKSLGKAFKAYQSRFGRLKEWLLPFAKPQHEIKWVLRDIDFMINPGEAIGIVGTNGAGKSTLLKMLTGTTKPTAGSMKISGRVAALLELGIGFHPEFTGRQNVYMTGQLLGMTVNEIRDCMPQIEEFAEIGDYIDSPVRVYSSGMQMRLAFSVATVKRPDILIVDEALSVGDAYFQHKSFDRIRQFKNAGTTLLIVSHDRIAIQSICDRVILLDGGTLAKEGNPEEVMDFYNALIADRNLAAVAQTKMTNGRSQTLSGTGEATVSEINLLDKDGHIVEMVDVGAEVSLKVTVAVNADIPRLILGFMIKDRFGQAMFGTNTYLENRPINNAKAGEVYEYVYSFRASFGENTYSVSTALHSTDTHLADNYEWRDLALLFSVSNLTKPHFVGCNWLEPTLQIVRRV